MKKRYQLYWKKWSGARLLEWGTYPKYYRTKFFANQALKAKNAHPQPGLPIKWEIRQVYV